MSKPSNKSILTTGNRVRLKGYNSMKFRVVIKSYSGYASISQVLPRTNPMSLAHVPFAEKLMPLHFAMIRLGLLATE